MKNRKTNEAKRAKKGVPSTRELERGRRLVKSLVLCLISPLVENRASLVFRWNKLLDSLIGKIFLTESQTVNCVAAKETSNIRIHQKCPCS